MLVLATSHLVHVVHRPSVLTDPPYVFVSDANGLGQSTVCALFESSEHCVCVGVCVCVCVCVVGVFVLVS